MVIKLNTLNEIQLLNKFGTEDKYINIFNSLKEHSIYVLQKKPQKYK